MKSQVDFESILVFVLHPCSYGLKVGQTAQQIAHIGCANILSSMMDRAYSIMHVGAAHSVSYALEP